MRPGGLKSIVDDQSGSCTIESNLSVNASVSVNASDYHSRFWLRDGSAI